jgi:hypothetical protein
MYKKIILSFAVVVVFITGFAENGVAFPENDSVPQMASSSENRRNPFAWKSQIFPSAMIATGGAMMLGNINETVTGLFPETDVAFDNYLQYAPMFELYIADIAGVKAKNDVWTQTKYLVFSQLICGIATQALKYSIRKQRPNNREYNSFPSGHTGLAFVGATVLYREFKDSNKFLAYSGFAVATAIGVLRITNRRHWISDVLAGAGIGILSTNLIYYFEPLKNWNPFPQSGKISLSPYYTGENAGLSLAIKL